MDGFKKCCLWLLLIYIALNHTVRYTARGASFGPEQTLSMFAKSAVPATLRSVDGFRLRTGSSVRAAGTRCPKRISRFCEKGAYGVTVVLGLY